MAQRKIPDFHHALIGPPNYFRIGLLAFLFFLPLSFSLIFTNNKTHLDWIIFLLFLVVDLILFATMILTIDHIVRLLKQKSAWLKASESAQLAIVERKMNFHDDPYDQNGVWVDGWNIGLAMTTAQHLAVKSKGGIVWVGVGEAQYRKYANKSMIRIHYSVKDPFFFLLEDEV